MYGGRAWPACRAIDLEHSGKQKYGRPVDVWSLGVVLFMMLTGEPLLTAGKEARREREKVQQVFL